MPGFTVANEVLSAIIFAVPVAILSTLVALLLHRAGAKSKPQPLRAFGTSDEVTDQPSSVLLREVEPGNEPELRLRALQTQLAGVNGRVPNPALAPLYLELAKLQHGAGDDVARLSSLRSAAGLAAQHGPRSIHAEARLELAEVAYRCGDLTSACEHWQMARTALLDDGQREAHARVEQRMRDHGCPTDWVLTDF